jgi:MFS family permease
MSTRQIGSLFLCALVPWTLGNALFALLPVFAARLGASSSEIGNYLASAFAMLTVGTIAAGRIVERFRRPRTIIIIVGLLEAFPALLMTQVTQFWQLIVLTGIVWLVGGIGISTITILAGLAAGERERGKIFGILAMTGGLGGVIGGAISGPIVDHWGFAALFIVAGLVYLLQSLTAVFITVTLPQQPEHTSAETRKREPLGLAFYLLFAAAVVASIPTFIASLGRPLEMDTLKFDASAISGVVSIGSAVALPFPLLLGWLSDHLGRYRLLALCIGCSLAGSAILAGSSELWHFWLSGALLAMGGSVGAIGPALVADLVPASALGEGLAQFGATGWIGGVIGLMGAGYVIQAIGFQNAALVGTVLAGLGLAFLFGTRWHGMKQVAVDASLDFLD